jgi:uncharacterized protein (DUF433 family)
MTVLEQAKELVSRMNQAEKAEFVHWVVRDLSRVIPGIESRPEVCGGEPCIARTRIPVWLLEQARRQGVTEAELLRCYPTLHATDLANAWAYVQAFPDQIERQIRENEEA